MKKRAKKSKKRAEKQYQQDNPLELDLEDHAGARFHGVDIKAHNKFQNILKKAPRDLLYISLCNRKLQWPFITVITQQNFQNLSNLSIDGNRLGAIGCKYLSRGQWTSLKTLQLQKNDIEDAGVSHLVKSQFPQLQLITLKENKITDRGVRLIVGNPWRRLRVLYLRRDVSILEDNQITYFGSLNLLSTHSPKKQGVYGFERLYLSLRDQYKSGVYKLKELINAAYPQLKFFDVD